MSINATGGNPAAAPEAEVRENRMAGTWRREETRRGDARIQAFHSRSRAAASRVNPTATETTSVTMLMAGVSISWEEL